MRTLAVLALIMVSACQVSVDEDGNTFISDQSSHSEFGPCGGYEIVGTYENGFKFHADCSFEYGQNNLVFQQYSTAQIEDPSFRSIQWFQVDDTRTLSSAWCSAQLFNGVLHLDCENTLSYRGRKKQ